jgi:hypothetical protein
MTIDTHHHIIPDFFWQATENHDAPVGGLAPLRWPREALNDSERRAVRGANASGLLTAIPRSAEHFH